MECPCGNVVLLFLKNEDAQTEMRENPDIFDQPINVTSETVFNLVDLKL